MCTGELALTPRSRGVLMLAVIGCAAMLACNRPPAPAAGSGARANWPKQLTFGVAAGSDIEALTEFNTPLVARLEQATGIPVKLYVATNYSVIVEAMRTGRVQGMQTGVFSYLLAVQEGQAEAVAVMIYTDKNPAEYDSTLLPWYYSVISAKKGRGIRTLADLKGRSFNFVEEASTSGHLVPETELRKAGLIPGRDVKTRFSGSHQSSLVSLWHDKADAAATAETILARMAAGGQIDYCGFPDHTPGRRRSSAEVGALYATCPDGHVVPIHYSDPIPATPIALRRDLPDDLKAIIKASLLSTPADAAFIKAAHRWYVDPTKEQGLANLDAFYNPLRDMAKLLDLDLKTLP